MGSTKIAVLIHLFYIDMWDDICHYLNNLNNYEYDLYINLVDGFHDEEIVNKVKNFNVDARIIKSPNQGVDIGGFLFLYEILDKEYDLILKIHTKKSLGLKEKPSDYVKVYGYDVAKQKGTEWFHKLMNGVLKSNKQVNDIIDLLNNDTPFAMAGLDCETYVGPNINEVKHLSNIFSIPIELNGDRLKNMSFVGGTIFWVRGSILKKYLTKNNIKELLNLLPKNYNNEPSYNHATERLFGLMVYNEKKKIINI